MPRVYIDTSHFIATVNPRDSLHVKALRLLSTADRTTRFVTSDSVLVELLAYCSRPPMRRLGIALVEATLRNPSFEIIRQTPELFDAAFQLYRERPDKGYSLTDCMSMVICAEHDISDVFTHDHHFKQEGLRPLL